MKGKVYIIGAGCGSYDLITLRGLELLKKADVIVCDALIDSKLLLYADSRAEIISVGKRAGSHSASQEFINELLVKKAFERHTVARIKGGDPFVFGRGGEEIIALKEANIPFAVVPGVSSAIAVPELAGIPVTHRRLSRSFHVITGHTADESTDYSKYALLDGTLVFLMGLGNIGMIAEGLISGGKPPHTPAAVIYDGASSVQTRINGTLADIAGKVLTAHCKAPAVIVVGETAGMELAAAEELPLRHISVAVTGTADFCIKLSGRLTELGADVRAYPYVRTEEYDDLPLLDKAFEHLEDYGFIVFTGRRSADIFMRRMKDKGIDVRRLSSAKIAVIGRSTAGHLAGYGLYADIVPEIFTSAELGRAVAENTGRSRKILIARAEKGSGDLTGTLDSMGCVYDDIKLYDTVADYDTVPKKVDADYIVFGSAAGIKGFIESGAELSETTKIVCTGSVTASAQSIYRNIITASPHNADGIINAIITEES